MRTLVNFLLDETGSMSSIWNDTIKGFNQYVDGLKEQGNNVGMTLTLFNSSKVEVRFVDKPVAEVPHLNSETYRPNSGTPLYDAIGKTVAELEKKSPEGAVLFVIMTDGEENSSIEYSKEDILKLINRKQKEGWKFAYLGADADTWDGTQAMRGQAMDIGIMDGDLATYGRGATGAAVRSLSGATERYAMASMKGGAKLASSINFFASEDYIGSKYQSKSGGKSKKLRS